MLVIQGPWIRDKQGRTAILRGVNLGGSSKVPATPNGASHIRESFFEHRAVSFVGRPFPLSEAEEHFSRLRAWGLTFVRFLVTWEAIEHAGPGIYDEEYLEYVREVLEKAREHGIQVFIDPHHDVWSRFCGGDGAPGWTLEAVGMDITQFGPTGAAIVHQIHGDPFPRMIWPTNATKLAAATMSTLFFGGDAFAPATRIDGEPAQQFLQRHYVEAIRRLAMKLSGLPNVVGYDTLNEPIVGYIGWKNLAMDERPLKLGLAPSPFQSMLLGEGFPQQIAEWEMGVSGAKRVGSRLVNAEGVRCWKEGAQCVWRANGVWELDESGSPHLLRPDYFAHMGGRPLHFGRDFLRPFINRYVEAIRSVDPRAIIFVESDPLDPSLGWGKGDVPNIVFAPHWYDGFVLFMKRYFPFLAIDFETMRLVVGRRRIRRSFRRQLRRLRDMAEEQLGGVPTVIGEFGIAYDLNDEQAYRDGDFSEQIKAMDRSFRAIEDNLLSCTLWNYTADNSNAHGDQWNDEDFSIFSRDQQRDARDINSGGRALQAVVRPYPMRIAGEPLRVAFHVAKKEFTFAFRHDPRVSAPTEIFVPRLHYGEDYGVEISDGAWEKDPQQQVLLYRHGKEQEEHWLRLRPG
jgi:hypothetical protein